MAFPSNEWRFWLALRLIRGIGPVIYQSLLKAFDHPQAVFAARTDALECASVRPEMARAIRTFNDWESVDQQFERLQRCGAALITWNDSSYPALLRHIHDPPPFLFACGQLHAADALAVAVVGSRNVSGYGLRMARELTQGLVSYGVTVVSGLARGTDAAAHWAALRGGGRTIAVLGSGVDVIYPGEHRALALSVAQQGVVLSEFLLGTQPDAENFPGRNRIISGMSLGTLVIEAAEKSGSLITALFAVEQGREVFAVPGPVGARSGGTHRLIRHGAKLTEKVEDILEEIAPRLLGQRQPVQLQLGSHESTLMQLLREESLHIDALIERSKLPASVALQTLLELELRGLVQQLPGKCFAACGPSGRE